MNIFKIVVIFLPIVTALVAVRFRNVIAVRIISVGVILIVALLPSAGLLLPNRVALELLGSPQSSDWVRGARGTRDVVQVVFPALIATLAAFAFVAVVPHYVKKTV
jgi:hypothetical protein